MKLFAAGFGITPTCLANQSSTGIRE